MGGPTAVLVDTRMLAHGERRVRLSSREGPLVAGLLEQWPTPMSASEVLATAVAVVLSERHVAAPHDRAAAAPARDGWARASMPPTRGLHHRSEPLGARRRGAQQLVALTTG